MGALSKWLASRRRTGPEQTEEEYHASIFKSRLARLALVNRAAPYASAALLAIGYLWLLLLPLEHLGRSTFIDENAIQPGQVNNYFAWDSVQIADRQLDMLKHHLNSGHLSDFELKQHLSAQLASYGLLSSTQNFTFETSLGQVHGTNVWASFTPPRTSSTEVVVVAASWDSIARVGEHTSGVEDASVAGRADGERMRNLRGVAMVLSLAEYLRGTHHYAKTLVFVISDHHLDGMQAFLSAYHGVEQPNMRAEELQGLQPGVIWTAFCVDYPGHSFSHVGLYFEGTNGRLPNQDLLNTVAHVTQYNSQIPIRLYQQSAEYPSFDSLANVPFIGGALRWMGELEEVSKFIRAAKGLIEHWGWAGLGRSSGVHGVFLQYRIDAVTLFAIPAVGPHGFYSLGRAVESSLRAVNNLLERLHASLFFYLYLRPGWFTKVGSYLPAGVIIGIGVSVRGLSMWKTAGEGGRHREVFKAGSVIVGCHALALVAFSALTSLGCFSRFMTHLEMETTPVLMLVTLVATFEALRPLSTKVASRPSLTTLSDLPLTISSLSHLCVGAAIPTLAMLNFPQATLLATVLIPPLFLSTPSPVILKAQPSSATLLAAGKRAAIYAISPLGALALAQAALGPARMRELLEGLISGWEIQGNWCWPGIWGVWWAVWAQTALVACVAG